MVDHDGGAQVKMTPDEKLDFINDALYHELRCLLGATTVWRAFQEARAGFDVVVAEDSAFVHARCLLNFFTSATSGNDLSIAEFVPKEYVSPLYIQWKEALNRHVLHVGKGRMKPTNLKGGDHLSEQVEALAREVLRLWQQFETDPTASAYAVVLRAARERAIQDARNDAGERTNPLFICT
jgi:hypothetical protein